MRSLRSAVSRTCAPRRSPNGCADRSLVLQTAGPCLWNSLPLQSREPNMSFNCFKTSLYTFLFEETEIAALCNLSLRAPYINKLTYLLTYSLIQFYKVLNNLTCIEPNSYFCLHYPPPFSHNPAPFL